jgi:hypothetical protein
MKYVLGRSWHSILTTTRTGAVLTRCGRRYAVEGTLSGPLDAEGTPQEVHATSDTLPMGDKSCELCLRMAIRNGEALDVDNDVVPG